DDAILRLVALRQYQLLGALEGRGHAALVPIDVRGEQAVADEVAEAWREGALPYVLEKARAHPEWAVSGGATARGLNEGGEGDDDGREAALAELVERLP
ncbi:DUF3482 domain-containing protein, partial [Thauera sp.]|uniref:DUF3482 domain-containing protein n=1 Tax=Thauera sp. TaxID=1905334 RepID=UPI00257DABBF